MKGRLKRHIVLIGMMGAGKTVIGTELARRLHVGFTDSDVEIESAAAMTINEIFARDGEAFFRDRETQVLARLLNGAPGVVSTGGGAWMRAENRDLIAGRALSVWLSCDLETLWQRVRHRQTRPLLQTSNPKEVLAELLNKRNPVYAQAEMTFPAQPGETIEAATERLIGAIRRTQPDLLERK